MSGIERVAALVSAEAYKAPGLRDAVLANLWRYDAAASDEVTAVYVNEGSGTVLVGFRGTTIGVQDLALVWGLLGGSSVIRQRAVAERRQHLAGVRRKYIGKKVVLTGHSKGAWLASSLATASDEVHGFAPATSFADIVSSWMPKVGPQPKVVYHSVAGDVISLPSYFLRNATHDVTLGPALFKTLIGGAVGAISAHKVENFTS